MDRYGDYKDSGIDWIGEIPSDWDCGKVKRSYHTALGKMLSEKQTSENSLNLPYLCAANIKETGFNLDTIKEMAFEEDEIETYSVETGDLLVVEGGNVGAAQIWEGPRICIQNSLHRVRTSDNSSLGYLKYWLAHAKASGQIDLICNKATIAHFTKDKLMNCSMVYPPRKTQAAIATFLDNKVKLIDSIVEEASKAIVLLHEYRQSIITEAVTHGLKTNASMKPSGVEWIERVPESWQVNSIRGVTSLITNGYVGPTRDLFHNSGVRYIQSLHIVDGKLNFDKHPYYVSEKWSRSHARSLLKEGDVLVVQTGAIGNCAYVTKEYEGCNCHALIILRPDEEEISGKYLYYYLTSHVGREKMLITRTGTTHPHLNSTKVQFVQVVIPPICEQYEIVEYLDAKTAEIDTLIASKERQVELLHEYRKSIISEAVTGKFKVPGLE